MEWLLETAGFRPRSSCGTGWTTATITLSVAADLLVFLAYVAIPLVLLRAYRWMRREIPAPDLAGKDAGEAKALAAAHPLTGFPRWVVAGFALFILSCGVGHLWEAVVFAWPAYRLFTVWDILTAVSSWATLVGAVSATRWLREKFGVLWEAREKALAAAEAARRAKAEAIARLTKQNAELTQLIADLRRGRAGQPPPRPGESGLIHSVLMARLEAITSGSRP